MLYETVGQGREFAALLSAGMAMGAVSMAFSGIRRVTEAGKWQSLFWDCAMGGAWAAVVCAALTAVCGGRARAFHFLALASGGCLFMAAVSPGVRDAARWMGKIGRKLGGMCRQNGFLRAVFR